MPTSRYCKRYIGWISSGKQLPHHTTNYLPHTQTILLAITNMSAPVQNAPQQDSLDKAVQMGTKKAGHEQSASTTEKISDKIRTGL
jgi:hypothetical protein